MKRLFSLILSAALFLSFTCVAAADGVTFSTKYFTLELPEGWEIDMDNLESEEGEECLGFFGEPEDIGLIAGAYLVYYENLKDIALWSSDAEELEAYTEALLEDFAEDNPELIGNVMAGKIPLVMIKGTDKEGEYVYADTMTNGYALEFEFYVTDEEGKTQYPITEEHIERIKDILATFQPVT